MPLDAQCLALSISCFLVAACIGAFAFYDLRKLRRGLREGQELDREPARSEPGFLKAKRNKP